MPFGVASAPRIFQRTIENLLQVIPGTMIYPDETHTNKGKDNCGESSEPGHGIEEVGVFRTAYQQGQLLIHEDEGQLLGTHLWLKWPLSRKFPNSGHPRCSSTIKHSSFIFSHMWVFRHNMESFFQICQPPKLPYMNCYAREHIGAGIRSSRSPLIRPRSYYFPYGC